MTLIMYGILLAHLNAYKQYYNNIFITFAITYVIKRLVKTAGQPNQADIVGLGGYSLTILEFTKLLEALKRAGFKGSPEEANKIIGGMMGEGIDLIKGLFTK